MSHTITVQWPAAQVAVIRFSDGQRQNTLSWAAVAELAASVSDCRQQGAVVIVLASALPGHWLQHACLNDLQAGLQGLPTSGPGTGWFELLQQLTSPALISIAAITGDTSGGGAELGWACDLRVAEEQALFSQPEVNMGLTTGVGGCSRLARLAGKAITTDMVLTGAAVSARRLYDCGAITRLVPAGQGLEQAVALALQLATKPGPALAGLKSILAAADQLPLQQALDYEQQTFQQVAGQADNWPRLAAVQRQYDAGQTIAEVHNYQVENKT